jgi:hypothetical protein
MCEGHHKGMQALLQVQHNAAGGQTVDLVVESVDLLNVLQARAVSGAVCVCVFWVGKGPCDGGGQWSTAHG